jgi:UDP-N-acetylmuramoyl-L-alanyl-D-glutamate--2,6-diaminopimelate ligase
MMAARQTRRTGVALSALLRDFAAVSAAEERTVTGIALDSRQVRPGDLFLACRGLARDGHEFIAAAVEQGAAAVAYDVASAEQGFGSAAVGAVPLLAVVDLTRRAGTIAERFYGEPSRALFVAGITGTNGKTSCSQFLAQALSEERAPWGVIGTLGNGLVNRLEAGTHTTPDAVTLHRLLAELRDGGARGVAMEVSSHALDQGRVAGVYFTAAIFTNLSRDHLDYHGDMAAYGAAKRRLFESPGLRYAILNGDDAFGRDLLAGLAPEVTAVSYGFDAAPQASVPHVRGRDLRLGRDGLTFTVESPWGTGSLRSALLGRFNASNLLAVLAALLITGMPFGEALQRLARVRPVTGRMECFGGDGARPLVVVDYAHTPDALEQALSALREHCGGRLWCVFGCGGDRDRGKRPLMGAAAARFADRVIVTDDNPRSEDPAQIVAEILGGVADQVKPQVIHDRDAAIAAAIRGAGPDDVVLVAGKGHETVQQIGTRKLPFRDQEAVRRHLAEARS